MEPENQNEKLVEESPEQFADVTRDELYELVWAEPMLRVAAEQPAITGPDAKLVYAARGTSAISGLLRAVSVAGGR